MGHKYQNSTMDTNNITIEQDRLIGHTKAGHGMWFFQIFPKYQSLWFSTNPSTFIKSEQMCITHFRQIRKIFQFKNLERKARWKKRNLFFAKINVIARHYHSPPPPSLSLIVSWGCSSCFDIVLIIQACIYQWLKIFYYTIQTIPLIH